MIRTRFAPSPTGPLHLGHAYAAHVAWSQGAECMLRIEDLDQSRARPRWEAQIFEDLAWLGFSWPHPVMRQSTRGAAYGKALDRLWDMGVLYPCDCSRRDIKEAASAPQEGAPLIGPDGLVYPGTCRDKPRPSSRPAGVLRLHMARAIDLVGTLPNFVDTGPVHPGHHQLTSTHLLTQIGDVVLARQDMAAAYHLAVVVDDAAQEITHVSRGADLFEATPIHVLLQALLGLPIPTHHHHALVRDETGKRLAKRDDARSIATYRAEGLRPAEVMELVLQGL